MGEATKETSNPFSFAGRLVTRPVTFREKKPLTPLICRKTRHKTCYSQRKDPRLTPLICRNTRHKTCYFQRKDSRLTPLICRNTRHKTCYSQRKDSKANPSHLQEARHKLTSKKSLSSHLQEDSSQTCYSQRKAPSHLQEDSSQDLLLSEKRPKANSKEKEYKDIKPKLSNQQQSNSDQKLCKKREAMAITRPQKNKRTPIPAYVLHQVSLRDEGQCSYYDHKGQRCSSRRFYLEVHHRKPVSQGGGNDVGKNLQVNCSSHL